MERIYNEQSDETKQIYTTFIVKGNSMDDGTRTSFECGDKLETVAVSIYELKETLTKNLSGFWIIEVANDVLIRQITEYNQINNTVLCHALNINYKDMIIDLANINKVYKVVRCQPKQTSY